MKESYTATQNNISLLVRLLLLGSVCGIGLGPYCGAGEALQVPILVEKINGFGIWAIIPADDDGLLERFSENQLSRCSQGLAIFGHADFRWLTLLSTSTVNPVNRLVKTFVLPWFLAVRSPRGPPIR